MYRQKREEAGADREPRGRAANLRGKKGEKRAVICGYIGCNGQNLFEVYTIDGTFPAKLVHLTEVSQFFT